MTGRDKTKFLPKNDPNKAQNTVTNSVQNGVNGGNMVNNGGNGGSRVDGGAEQGAIAKSMESLVGALAHMEKRLTDKLDKMGDR